MSDYVFETPLGIEVTKLIVIRVPLSITVEFTDGAELSSIRFTNPLPLSTTTEAIHCWQIRIVDRNASGMQLEFGRYNVELWDEDNPVAQFTIDTFEVSPAK